MLVLLLYMSGLPAVVASLDLSGVHCSSLPTYVTVESNIASGYMPYVVRVNRCVGKVTPHLHRHCVTVRSDRILMFAFTATVVTNTTVENHTHCEERCVLKASQCNQYEALDTDRCECRCKHTTPPASCIAPFRWEPSSCDCKCKHKSLTCPFPDTQVFSPESCGCQCKAKYYKRCAKKPGHYLNATNCLCKKLKAITQKLEVDACGKSSRGVSSTLVFIVVLMEALVIVLAIFLLNYFFRRRREQHSYHAATAENNNSTHMLGNGELTNYAAASQSAWTVESASSYTPSFIMREKENNTYNNGYVTPLKRAVSPHELKEGRVALDEKELASLENLVRAAEEHLYDQEKQNYLIATSFTDKEEEGYVTDDYGFVTEV